jgi:hypothetical protein
VESAAKHIPCLFSPNMSVAMNLLFRLAEEVAKALGADYDAEIVETHHRFKKDAPSGTALKLAESIAAARGVTLGEVAVFLSSFTRGDVTADPALNHVPSNLRVTDMKLDHALEWIARLADAKVVKRIESRWKQKGVQRRDTGHLAPVGHRLQLSVAEQLLNRNDSESTEANSLCRLRSVASRLDTRYGNARGEVRRWLSRGQFTNVWTIDVGQVCRAARRHVLCGAPMQKADECYDSHDP